MIVGEYSDEGKSGKSIEGRQEFTQWQDGVRAAMVEIMKFPEIKRQPSPVCVKTEKKEGCIR